MLISYNWLNEYVDLTGISAQQLANQMSLTGIEIEGVTKLGDTLKKLVIGYTISVEDHPNSDHLHICQVDVGMENAPEDEGVLQIVCGAPNVASGQKVIVALPGARIKDNIKIKKGKIRGEASYGMICSLQELGIGENVVPKQYSDGIFVLPSDAPIGENVITYLGLDDAILELSITPNRADAVSMYGAAHEVSAIYSRPYNETLKVVQTNQIESISDYVSVSVEDTQKIPAYYMAVIKNVTVKESPLWLQMRLMLMDIRPINNVVDVTNYMLLQYGQPLHAFDYDTLPDKNIYPRLAKDGETLVTLDNQVRELSSDDIVITSDDEVIALAGVMGGLETEITDKTVNVALESALFDAKSIAKTARKFNLRSQASQRFEKGIHRSLVKQALEQAAMMIVELSGGQLVNGYANVDTIVDSPANVDVRISRINQVLGTQLSYAEITQIFDRLGFTYEQHGDVLHVSVPSRRFDIAIEADLIEEVARMYGYDNLPATLPDTPSIPGGLSKEQRLMRDTRQFMQSCGFNQVVNYSLLSHEKANMLAIDSGHSLALAMPMSEEHAVLRRSLVPGLLDNAQYNAARRNTHLAFSEIGRVFNVTSDAAVLPKESEHLALLIAGSYSENSWYGKGRKVDFFDLKGVLDDYFKKIGVFKSISYQQVKQDGLHPGRTANIFYNNEKIGYIAQLHPAVAKSYDLPDTYVSEINLEKLFSIERDTIVQNPVPKYPGTSRDIAILVDKEIPQSAIVDIITEYAGRYLNRVHLFDYYDGDGIPDNQVSLAYRLEFLNLEATLVEDEVNQSLEKVINAMVDQLKATIR